MARKQNNLLPGLAWPLASLRNDFDMAKSSRYRRQRSGISSMGSGADYHYRNDADYLRMMELARDFDRNDVVVGQAVDRLVDNVMQDGIKLDPQTGNTDADKMLADKWRAWSTDPDACDSAGEMDFNTIAEKSVRAVFVDGDIAHLPINDGTIETIEAHRIRTPRNTRKNVVNGILLNGVRKRIQYWITKDDISPTMALNKVGDTRQIPTRDANGYRQVFHVYNPKRVSQTRGITAFAPIVNAIGMHDDIQFAKLVQQQLVSCFAIIREMSTEGFRPPGDGAEMGEKTTQRLPDGTSRTVEGIAPGMQINGLPGETIKGFSPNVPNAEFFDHANLILTFISINLGLPLAVMLLDPSKTNFSGWRGAIDQARNGFRKIQNWMILRFHRPVYIWKVRQWMAEDEQLRNLAEQDGVDIFGHKWNRPGWRYIEPLKDATANKVRKADLQTSPRRLMAEHGMDLDDVRRETIEDNAAWIVDAATKATELKGKGIDVDWRDLVVLNTTAKPVEKEQNEDKNNAKNK